MHEKKKFFFIETLDIVVPLDCSVAVTPGGNTLQRVGEGVLTLVSWTKREGGLLLRGLDCAEGGVVVQVALIQCRRGLPYMGQRGWRGAMHQ